MPRRKSQLNEVTPKALSDLAHQNAARALFLRIQQYRKEVIFAPPFPAVIYHYTSREGFAGILESDRLWATHAGHLRDTSEIEHGCGVVRALLQKRRTAAKSAVARAFFDKALTSFNLNELFGIYVASFSEDGDLVSQWETYADRARGVSIGVPTERLILLGGGGGKFFVSRTIYERVRQENVIDTIVGMTVNGLMEMTKGLKTRESEPWILQACKVLQDSLWMMLVVFKNPAFRAEREWRAIRVVAPDEYGRREVVKEREVRGRLVPYVELDFLGGFGVRGERMPITRLVHGPTADPAAKQKELRAVLDQHGHANATIAGSAIPLRIED